MDKETIRMFKYFQMLPGIKKLKETNKVFKGREVVAEKSLFPVFRIRVFTHGLNIKYYNYIKYLKAINEAFLISIFFHRQ